MNDLTKQIAEEIHEFDKQSLDINPSFAPTQRGILNLIDSYWMNKFRDGDRDDSGFKKAFFNVIGNPTQVASKMLDLDSKDVRVVAEEGQSYYPAWLFGKELRLWMKEKKNCMAEGLQKTFGQFLNNIVYNFPKYGSIVLKKAQEKIYLTPLHNLHFDTSAETLLETPVVEEHSMTAGQMRAMKEWDEEKVEEAITKFGESGGKIKLYERSELVGSKINYSIIAGNLSKKDGITIEDTTLNEFLYKELHYDKVPGRWLGRGNPEKLFEAQIAKNQNEVYFRQGLRWTSKHLWQTRDELIASNLLTDVENGDIIISPSEVNPISMEERNLHSYRASDSKWDENIAKETFSYDVIRGERPPAGTPLGSAKIAAVMTSGFFDMKREDLGMFLKEVLWDWVIPDFKKHKGSVHKLMLGEFSEDEVEKLRRLISTDRFNKSLIDYIAKNGRIPDRAERDILRTAIRERLKTKKDLTIPVAYYDNAKINIDFIITAEQIDMAARLSTLSFILQILGSNPTIFRDARARKVFYQALDLSGINPTQFEIEEEEEELAGMAGRRVAERAGGGVSRMPPVMGAASATIPQTL